MTFLNTLTLFNVGEIFVNFIAGLYTSVAKAYSLLMTFATGTTNNTIANSINGFAKSAYTLVGIFMVFRLAISILTYLIDPEKMSDKQVGASKLISRIVISVILLITLNTFIFPILSDIETALLDPDSIIFNIFPNPFGEGSAWSSMNDTSLNNKIILNNNNFNIENTIIPSVKAVSSNCNVSSMKNQPVLFNTSSNLNIGSIGYIANNCKYPTDRENIEKMLSSIFSAYYQSYELAYSSNYAIKYGLEKKSQQVGVYSYYFRDDDDPSQYSMYNCLNDGMGTVDYWITSTNTATQAITPTKYTKNACYNMNVIEELTSNKDLDEMIKQILFKLDNSSSSGEKITANITYYQYTEGSNITKKYFYAETDGKTFTGPIIELDFNEGDDMSDYKKIYTKSGGTESYFQAKSVSNSYTYDDLPISTQKIDFDDGYMKKIVNANGHLTDEATLAHLTYFYINEGSLVFSNGASNAKYICRGTTIEDTIKCVKEQKKQVLADTELYNIMYQGTTTKLQMQGLGFARSVLSSFTDKPDVITEGVEDKGLFMESSAANDALGVMAENKEIMFDWFLAIIAGLGVIVYLWILCIEVIIRNIKIIFLQIIAPIPVICYMNPNDKVLSSWFKQYIGTYLDLFIKLLAINAGFRFITLITEAINPVNGFATFLIYCGGFLFIKAAPTFISKVFGLENMSGTFKDSAGLVKTGLMAGTGAVVDGVAGAVSGMGKGGTFSTVAGGLFGGAARGFSSGAKGKVFDGAKTQIGRNTKAKAAYMDGASWGQRMLSKVGMDSASRTDRNLKDLESDSKQYEAFKKHKESIDQTAEASNFIKDLRSQRLADGSARYSESEIKAARKNFINHNSNAGNKGTVSSFQMTDRAGNKVTVSAGYEDSKAGAIQSELTKAESLRSGSSTINKVSSAPISDYAGLDNADTAVTNAKISTDEAIYAAKSTDTYRVGDASRNSNSNNGNK